MFKISQPLAADEGTYGPAMSALVERMQNFVVALFEQGDDNLTKAYITAGYSSASMGGARVGAHRLAHDERIQAAIREEAARRIGISTVQAAEVVKRVMNDPTAGNKDRLRAAEMLLNRGGLPIVTEHTVHVHHEINDRAELEKVKLLALKLGMDPVKVLGSIGIVDAEFTEVPAQLPAPSDGTEGLEDLL